MFAGEVQTLISRETFRKIASLGHDILCSNGVYTRFHFSKSPHTWPGKTFLTLVYLRMLQLQGRIENDPAAPLPRLLSDMEAILRKIPHPTGQSWWYFFSNSCDTRAEQFWFALKDTHFDTLCQNPETLSWCYQYFLEPEFKLKTFCSLGDSKIKKMPFSFRTQQFTPRWIADFLAQNTIGRLWLNHHPDSRLVRDWPYLVPDPNTNEELKEAKPAREIKVLDPACGTMHLGFSAMKVMEMIYREELENAGKAGWPDTPSVLREEEIRPAILQHNLYGVDIDILALELAVLGFFVGMGAREYHPPNLYCGDSLKKIIFRKLRQIHFPTHFDIILLNPPYLDKRDYPPQLKTFMARHFKLIGRNLYSAFLDRSIEFLAKDGRIGAVTPQTFMFIRSFETFRRFLLDRTVIETLAHTGLNTFEDAVVDCSLYVLKRQDSPSRRDNHVGQYFQLTTLSSAEEKNACILKAIEDLRNRSFVTTNCYQYRQGDFNALPGSPWVYWISSGIRKVFTDLPKFSSLAQFRQGLATTDNERFIRYWWEIPPDRIALNYRNIQEAMTSGKKWFPYMKGGGYRKWYGMQKYLVNWSENGKEIKEEIVRRYAYLKGNWQWVAKNSEYYFREGVTYSYLTSGNFSARYSPPGSIFDVAGSSIFSDDPYQILGILNSRWCRFALGLINHTVNFQVGDLQRLPAPRKHSPTLNHLVKRAVELSKRLDTFDEISPNFISPPPWIDGCKTVETIHQELNEIQRQVDDEVCRMYDGLNEEDRKLIEHLAPCDHAFETITKQQLARQWISYSVGVVLGRYLPQEIAFKMRDALPNLHPFVPDDNRGFAADIGTALDWLVGREHRREIIETATNGTGLYSFLEREFFEDHFRQYHQRPIYWLLRYDSQLFVASYLNAADKYSGKFYLPHQAPIQFDFDLGIQRNMKRVEDFLALPSWRRYLK